MNYTPKGLKLPTLSEGYSLADVNFNTNLIDTLTTLPIASSTVLGGVKQGTNITIDSNGVISASGSGGGGGASYEEGTWTARLKTYDGVVLGTTTAYYKKVGKLCFIHFELGFHPLTDGKPYCIDGLPFIMGVAGYGLGSSKAMYLDLSGTQYTVMRAQASSQLICSSLPTLSTLNGYELYLDGWYMTV